MTTNNDNSDLGQAIQDITETATLLIREEIEDNPLPFLLTRPVSKPSLAVSKFAGYLIAGVALLLPPVVVAYGITEAYVGTGLGADVDVLEGFLAATALGVLAYGALFYLLSVVLRKPLMVGLLIGFVWESIVVSLPGSVPKLSITYYLRSVLGGMIAVGPYTGNPDYVSAPVAVAVLVVFSIVVLVLSAHASYIAKLPVETLHLSWCSPDFFRSLFSRAANTSIQVRL